MNDQPRVQIVSEPGRGSQFGRRRLKLEGVFRSGGSNRILIFGGVVLVVVATLVFSGKPKKTASSAASEFLGVEVQTSELPAVMLTIPQVGSRVAAGPRLKSAGAGGSPARLPGPQLVSRPRNVPIPPGSMAQAVLISGASDGPVKAELQEPLVVAGEPLLEAGTILMGTGQSGDERLSIQFRKAVFRDGSTAKIEAVAADSSDKIPGIKGSRVGYRALKLAAGAGLNFAAGLSQGLQSTQGQAGAVVTPATVKNALLNGSARASLDEGQEMMNEYRSERSVLTVSAGTVVLVLFSDGGS